MSDLDFDFDAKWKLFCCEVADDLELPKDTPIPASDTLAAALGEPWMEDAVREAERQCEFLAVLSSAARPPRVQLTAQDMPAPGERIDNPAGFRRELTIVAWTLREDGSRSIGLPLTGVLHNYLRDDWRDRDIMAGLDRGNPAETLVKAWLRRPVEADKRATAIMPATLSRVRDVVETPDGLFDLADYDEATGFMPRPELQAHLPGLMSESPEILSPLPLLMWDASTEGGPRRGKGAPLALRSWIEPVLSLPTAERFGIHTVEIAWGDFTNWLMPNGEYRQHNYPAIQRALADRPQSAVTLGKGREGRDVGGGCRANIPKELERL